MTIQALPAAHGDALIIQSDDIEHSFTIVIDGGPDETSDFISQVYRNLPHIDLLVLTHFDADHIFGIIRYFDSLSADYCVVDRLWVNCARLIDFDNDSNTSAMGNAFTLASHLSRLQEQGIIGEWRDDIHNDLAPYITTSFSIEIVSPTPKILNSLKEKYETTIELEDWKDDPDEDVDVAYSTVQVDASKTFDQLVKDMKRHSTSFMNQTSIAFYLKAEGKTVLLLGDADARIVSNWLSGRNHSETNRLSVDLMKMSHHGSKGNICETMMNMIDCNRFLFTTNGGDGGAYHPDRQTLACIQRWCKKEGEKLVLYFNYPLDTIMERNKGLLNDEEKQLFEIVDEYPNMAFPSIII